MTIAGKSGRQPRPCINIKPDRSLLPHKTGREIRRQRPIPKPDRQSVVWQIHWRVEQLHIRIRPLCTTSCPLLCDKLQSKPRAQVSPRPLCPRIGATLGVKIQPPGPIKAGIGRECSEAIALRIAIVGILQIVVSTIGEPIKVFHRLTGTQTKGRSSNPKL